jgi:ABC-type uncharacterized transport system fused permease/ATPase subunit
MPFVRLGDIHCRYLTLLRLGISFVSVGHRSQLKAFHRRLISFDGSGNFRALELPPPPSLDQHSGSSSEQIAVNDSSSSSNSSSKVQAAPFDITVSLSPSNPIFATSLRMLRICFTQHHSLKNLAIHAIIFVLFVFSFINSVVFTITITTKALLFQDTSPGFVAQYFFFSVIIQSLIDAVINAALAYVAVRTRKNLTRGLEAACVAWA